MPKFKLATFFEENFDKVQTFNTMKERDAFSRGLTYGANQYGAGSAYGINIPEDVEELQEDTKVGPDIMRETAKNTLDQLKQHNVI